MKKIILLIMGLILACSTNNEDASNTPAPAHPTNLTGTAFSHTQINLSWIDNSTNETGFKIERRTGSGIYEVVGMVDTNILTFSNTDLMPATTYFYRIYSFNSVGNSQTYSNEISITTPAKSIPVLSTTISSVTPSSIVCGGNINSDGGSPIITRGVVWSTSSNPTIALNTKTNEGTGIGAFTSTISGLSVNTTYYVRAYAINDLGTAYGNIESLITPSNLPTFQRTTPVTNITSSSAVTGGWIISVGGSDITSKGVVWSTSSNPTIALSTKTNDISSPAMSFPSTISGLTGDTYYYVRSYATNSFGTAYGNELGFKTEPSYCNDSATPYLSVVIGTQTWMKKNLDVCKYRNGDPIPQVTNPETWATLKTGAWCYYANSIRPDGIVEYGKLYNWYAVNDPRGLAPEGWHVSSKAEWDTLINFLGGQKYAGRSMKAPASDMTGWKKCSDCFSDGNNSSGFTALPGGYRDYKDSTFKQIGEAGQWWLSTEYDANSAVSSFLHYSSSSVSLTTEHGTYKNYGFSVRCVRD